jgi:putative membrane protein
MLARHALPQGACLAIVENFEFKGEKQMNKKVIQVAHIVAVGILLLIGVIVAAQPNPNTGQQNSNQQGGNANGNTSRGANANSSRNTGTAGQAGAGMSLSSADQKFAMEAAMGGMMEVELGRVAAQQGASDAVKQFGQRMVDDHSRANQQLMQLASSKGITLPTELDAKHRAELTKMSALSGAAFDSQYAKAMVKDHVKDVALFQKQSTRGADADLKSFAASTLPTLQEHLSMARSLNGTSGGGRMNGNSSNSNRGNGNTSNGNSNNSNRR